VIQQQLRTDDSLKSTWNDIELFAFGTYAQYRSTPASLSLSLSRSQ